ncbi:MAG: hypothetical protein AAGK00_17495 [Pseudomonadota bacterium]
MILACAVGMFAIMLLARLRFPKSDEDQATEGLGMGARSLGEQFFVNGLAAAVAITALLFGATVTQVAVGLVVGFVLHLIYDRWRKGDSSQTVDGEDD